MQKETEGVLKSLSDILLQLGCETGWLVSNSSLNSKNLNAAISNYQKRLDELELEVSHAISEARLRENVIRKSVPESTAAEQKTEHAGNDDTNSISKELDDRFDISAYEPLQNDLSNEIDYYNLNTTDSYGMFDIGSQNNTSLGQDAYGLAEDPYF